MFAALLLAVQLLFGVMPAGAATHACGPDRHAVDLPDSPLFDVLRPPTRA